jgi:aspartyl-tRNA(Asn)/glutamyl-tRNA(Gln) amidotransferase subunit A
MTIVEAGAALRARKISCGEMADEALGSAARENPRLNAFMIVTETTARQRAVELDGMLARGVDLGPLHGIPIAHKDCLFTKGVRTTWGSKLFADFVPDHDAEVVRRLDSAGAISIGKTGLHELTYGMTSNNPHFGAVRNPWDTARIPGGSSGGSGAAVAAGVVPLATGTDTGGSIRIPASFCGCVGFKPTFDRVSRAGCMPLGMTLDHVGPMTMTVGDAAIAFGVMADDVRPAEAVNLKGLRIGVPSNFFFERINPEVMLAVRRAVQNAAASGARVEEVRLPDVEALSALGRIVQLAEAAAVFERYAHRREDFGADVLALIDQGRLIPATEYLNAQRSRRVLATEFERVWASFDCLITPATPMAAPLIGQTEVLLGGVEEDVRLAGTRLARPLNVLGWPALAMPCGATQAGLPIGLQLIGAPGRDEFLLGAGVALEKVLGPTRP